MPNVQPGRVIRTKVVGVTFRNEDGTKRQRLIRKRCRKGTVLVPFREFDNPVDANAIGLYARAFLRRRRRIGYLSSSLASDLAPYVDHGWLLAVVVTEVTGGTWWPWRAYGVNVAVSLVPPQSG